VRFGFVGCVSLGGAHRVVDSLRVPRLPRGFWRTGGLVLKVLSNVALDVRVGTGIASLVSSRELWLALRPDNRVVHVEGCLLPGIDDDLLVGMIRMQRSDDTLDRIVEEHWADARIRDLGLALVQMRRAEERLVLLDGLAFVVEDSAAGADPAPGNICFSWLELAGLHVAGG